MSDIKKTRIFLADDHAILREGLRYILETTDEYKVVGESGDGYNALNKIKELIPDIAVVDISMPRMSGIELAEQLRDQVPNVKILILSRHDDEEYVNKLLQIGVKGYVLKDHAGENLLWAIRSVLRGEVYLSPSISQKLIDSYIQTGSSSDSQTNEISPSILSPREREIIVYIANGMSNKEISSLLFISDKTVKAHRANIMQKLRLHKAAELVQYALKFGMIKPD